MGRLFISYLDGRCYSCRCCGTQLASTDELVSKSFHSRNGKAYLFNSVVNVAIGPREERLMTTGLHEVSALHCIRCMQDCGWKYDLAHEKSQKYKEGKFILERAKMQDACAGYAAACPELAHAAPLQDSDSEDTCM